ncbi:hypothetical protein [Sphingobacterium sp. MYb382]|uniref:hypothetical protein n=1 Tax=Sphingobacterium sp. MYb382 TaxID=2745278 RepID=UPI00309D41AC
MKFKRLTQYILTLTLMGGVLSCQNPLKDFNLLISTEVVKHYVKMEVLTTEAQAVNATIKLTSGDTQDVYNENGYKDFKLVSNLVTFGLDPKRNPTVSDPVRFKVEVSAPGYVTQLVDVTISDKNDGYFRIRLAKPTTVPEGAAAVTKTVPINADGSLPISASVVVNNADGPSMTLNIPAGTQFLDANGKVITGGALTIKAVAFDPSDPNATTLFPGGRLQADGVVMPGGGTSSGTFNAGGSTTIEMVIDGVPIRKFSKPIAVGVELSNDFVLSSGAAPVGGGPIAVFSNSPSNPGWRHETQSTIKKVGNDLTVEFSVDHLTTFVVGEFVPSCSPVSEIEFSADWIEQGITHVVSVEAVKNNKVIASRTFSVSQTNKTVTLDYLPAEGVTIVVRRTTGDLGIVVQAPLAACGSKTSLTLPNPNPVIKPKVTLQLYVRCPNKPEITLTPNFDLYYRLAGKGAFVLLGEVKEGLLATDLLKSDGTKYDFKAVWKGRTKTVENKAVEADNSGTVGTKPGDIIGVKAGATNLGILTEECGKI